MLFWKVVYWLLMYIVKNNGVLKSEFLIETCKYRKRIRCINKGESIEIYNNKRAHLGLSFENTKICTKN